MMPDDDDLLDGPPDLAVDRVPTAGQSVPVATYRDWRPEDTRVIVCRVANDRYPGSRYETREAARAAVEAEHGEILEANYLWGRAYFRVRRKR